VREVAGGTVVEVVDPGSWAAFAQRHLLHHVESGVDCFRRVLGMPEQADGYRAQMERVFGGLRQYPLASVRMAKNRAEHAAAMRASLAILAAAPEAVGGHNWSSLLRRPAYPADSFAVPPLESWLQPLFPAGTYFEWPKRLWRPDRHLRVRGPALRQMHESLPYYSDLAEAAADDHLGREPAAADLAREYGPLLDYDVRLMVRVANAAKEVPAEYERLYRRIGALDPDRLHELAAYLAEKGRNEEAAAVYEEYVTKARDRVGVCNHVSWLVDHHQEHGNRERALELARQAGQVYCFDGLFTLADLHERRKEWTHAQEYFRRLAERYDSHRFLLTFYLRHERATHDAERYRSEREALLARFFPKGMAQYQADAPTPPEDGVVLVGTSVEAAKAGLQPQDVIVALNGFRVRDYDQYRVVRGLSRAPELDLVVWRAGRYLEIAARHPQRWFGVEVRSYKGAGEPERKYL
jgi:tetratricopeptide (TPR) repeat protein